MKKLIFILLAVVIIKSVNSQTHISSGIVSGHWYKIYSPYYIDGDIQVPVDSCLQIESGVKLIFSDSITMFVHGSISAIGKPTDSIYFDIADTSGFSDTSTYDGGWGGIRFFSSDSNSVALFQYCKFSHAKARSANDTLGNGGAIYVDAYNNIQFHNCEFYKNISLLHGGAIFYTNLCNILIDSCSITYNSCRGSGGGIGTEGHANSIISNSKILYNRCYKGHYNNIMNVGGGFFVSTDDLVADHQPILINNYICNNQSDFGGAIYESSFSSSFIGNIICNNTSYGAVIGHSISQSKYINNTICNNGYEISSNNYINYYQAGGILTFSLNIKVRNNIIRNNFALGSVGYDSANIVYGYTLSTIKLYFVDYNNIENGYAGTANIDKDACFVNPTSIIGIGQDGYSADWSLSDSSASINAGTNDSSYYVLPPLDIYSNNRYYGLAIDQGAVENQNVVQNITSFSSLNYGLSIYPNPAKDILYLKSQNIIGDANYSVYNSIGTCVKSGILFSGINQILINNLNNGVYFIRVVEGEFSKTMKFVKE